MPRAFLSPDEGISSFISMNNMILGEKGRQARLGIDCLNGPCQKKRKSLVGTWITWPPLRQLLECTRGPDLRFERCDGQKKMVPQGRLEPGLLRTQCVQYGKLGRGGGGTGVLLWWVASHKEHRVLPAQKDHTLPKKQVSRLCRPVNSKRESSIRPGRWLNNLKNSSVSSREERASFLEASSSMKLITRLLPLNQVPLLLKTSEWAAIII